MSRRNIFLLACLAGLGIAAAPPNSTEHPVPLDDPAAWTVQPAWLANFTPHHEVATTAQGLRFAVRDSMVGAKWSRDLQPPMVGVRFVRLRYRAQHLRSGGDYVLYAAGGESPLQEQYLLREDDIISDGQWHVAIAPVQLAEIHRLAVQVQAYEEDAWLEVSDLRFLGERPELRLADVCESTSSWPAEMLGWRPIELPPGTVSGEELARRLGICDWFESGPVTIAGAPFQVRGDDAGVPMTPLEEPGRIDVPLSGRAAEAYLLLAAELPADEEPSYFSAAGVVRHVHRLVVRVDYEDGTSEEQFPFALRTRRHAVTCFPQAYAVALDPAKSLRSLALVDRMSRGAFALVALTLADQPGPATNATALQPAVRLPSPSPFVTHPTGITREGDRLTVQAGTATLAMSWKNGLRVESVSNRSGEGLEAHVAAGPLFRCLGDTWEMTSEDFVVERMTPDEPIAVQRLRIDLRCDKVSPEIRVHVAIDVEEPEAIGLQATIELPGRDAASIRFIFPELQDIRLGESPADVWIWCPRRGDVITNRSIALREPYAGAGNPLQVIGCFDPQCGTGLYLMTQDLEARSKFYHVQKTARGARLAVEYTPLHRGDLPRSVIGCCQGDWHEQLARYQQWVATWYQPAAPRKAWFRQVWNFRQQFLHFELPSKSGMYDEKTRTLRIKEIVDADAAAFGGVDYLHLFDWGWDPVHGRCGDYQPWEYLGGVENFRSAVAEVQAAGIPVGLYLEGILVDAQSQLGQAHGAQWQMLGPAGQPYAYFAPSFHVCPHVGAWQEYLSDTYARVQRETGASGFYIDQYGFSGPTYWCYNSQHGHPVPMTPVLGERAMTRRVRERLGPDAVIYTEESPTDVNSQYQDGSFTYNISSALDDPTASYVNLYRFAFPSFKTIEIICCDQPLGTNVEAVKRCLFNGEAIWIEGIHSRWFAPEVRGQIALNRRVLSDNRHCFAGDHVRPLVPTLVRGIYANQFGQRADLLGKTCWTVYNTHYRTVRGELIAVDHADGAQYLDEMAGQPLTPRVVDGRAYLTLEMAPRDVMVISRGLYVD
ncbi:MAG: DUF6259 domain-containing protein [Pirellulaceae bacterium]|nr:DUF6259 domain-containing protein [Pirellulaceae bacterium]